MTTLIRLNGSTKLFVGNSLTCLSLFYRLLAEQAEKAATDWQLRVRQRDVELKNMEERGDILDNRLEDLQSSSDYQLQEIAR